MRIVTPITVLALAGAGALLGRLGDLDPDADGLPHTHDATEAEVALEVRCGDLDSWMRRTCEEELFERFASGHANPEDVLRMHCTLARNVWDHDMPSPPPLCAARFGGWLSG